MKSKKINVRRLLKIMHANQISPQDLENEQDELNRIFYVMCREDHFVFRVPYEMGIRTGNICGIFPFEDSDIYLELDERLIPRSEANEKRLPTIEFMERLFEIKDKLNAQLELLGAPPIEGHYYAKNCCEKNDRHINWIVDFVNGIDTLPFEAYDLEDLAKARYIGIYGETQPKQDH